MHPLIRAHLAEINQLCQTRGITFLGLFGSFARGEESPQSDVDLLADFKQEISLLQIIALEQTLSNILHRKVDLVERPTLKPRIQTQVMQEMLKVYPA